MKRYLRPELNYGFSIRELIDFHIWRHRKYVALGMRNIAKREFQLVRILKSM